MLNETEVAELARLMRERDALLRGEVIEPLAERLARIRERLVTAFGEADVAAAEALSEAE